MITFTMVVLGFVFAALCAFLILLVLIQPGKSSGGGLGGLGGGAAGAIGETLGATQGEKTLSKWTSIGMAAFFGLCLLLTVLGNLQHSSQLNLGGSSESSATETAPEAGAAPAGETAPVTPAE